MQISSCPAYSDSVLRRDDVYYGLLERLMDSCYMSNEGLKFEDRCFRMALNKDISRYGWLLVGVILAYSGVQHMITQQLFGKVRMSGSSPSLEGWPVLVIGVLELFVGIIFIVRYLRTSRRG